MERSVFNRNPGSWFFKKTGLNRHRGVLSEKWAKKRVAKNLVLSNVSPISAYYRYLKHSFRPES
jgi:hypothetical protein